MQSVYTKCLPSHAYRPNGLKLHFLNDFFASLKASLSSEKYSWYVPRLKPNENEICDTVFKKMQFLGATDNLYILTECWLVDNLSVGDVSLGIRIARVHESRIYILRVLSFEMWRRVVWCKFIYLLQLRTSRQVTGNCSLFAPYLLLALCLLPSSRWFLAWLILRTWRRRTHVPTKVCWLSTMLYSRR